MEIKKTKRIHFKSIDSTHLWAKNQRKEFSEEDITCITAEEQTKGCGRFQRVWHSVSGNLFCTLFFTLPNRSSIASHIGQILCLSCINALKSLGFAPEIKWPNDLLLNEKKFAGVLTELFFDKTKIHVLTSVGMNINLSLEQYNDQPITSLAIISGKNWDIEEILQLLLQEFQKNLTILQAQGFSFFHELFNKNLAWKEKEVICKDASQTIKGICKGITQDGALKLLLEDQRMFLIQAADLEKSLRKA